MEWPDEGCRKAVLLELRFVKEKLESQNSGLKIQAELLKQPNANYPGWGRGAANGNAGPYPLAEAPRSLLQEVPTPVNPARPHLRRWVN